MNEEQKETLWKAAAVISLAVACVAAARLIYLILFSNDIP